MLEAPLVKKLTASLDVVLPAAAIAMLFVLCNVLPPPFRGGIPVLICPPMGFGWIIFNLFWHESQHRRNLAAYACISGDNSPPRKSPEAPPAPGRHRRAFESRSLVTVINALLLTSFLEYIIVIFREPGFLLHHWGACAALLATFFLTALFLTLTTASSPGFVEYRTSGDEELPEMGAEKGDGGVRDGCGGDGGVGCGSGRDERAGPRQGGAAFVAPLEAPRRFCATCRVFRPLRSKVPLAYIYLIFCCTHIRPLIHFLHVSPLALPDPLRRRMITLQLTIARPVSTDPYCALHPSCPPCS